MLGRPMRWASAVGVALLFVVCLAVVASAAPVTLRFIFSGTSETEKAWSVRTKERIEALHPDIQIEYMYIPWADLEKKVAVMLQAGDVPDLLLVQDVTNLVAMGALEPLDDYFDSPSSRLKRSDWYPSAWDYSVIGGKVYSAPMAAVAYGLVVREDYLTEAGIRLDSIQTWDDLLVAAQKTTKPPRYGYGYAAGLPRFAWRDPSIAAWSNGLLTLDNVSDSARPAYLETLTLYKTLRPYMSPAVVAWSYPEMFRAYALGQIAMMPNGNYFTANVYPINPDVIQHTRALVFPRGPSGKSPAGMVANVGVAMFKDGKHKDLAWKVIEEIASVEGITSWTALLNQPARRDVDLNRLAQESRQYYPRAYEAHARLIRDFAAIVDRFGVPQAKILHQSEMEVAFQAQIVQMLQGKLTPEQTYSAIRQEIQRIGR